jgi:hypothetical protein
MLPQRSRRVWQSLLGWWPQISDSLSTCTSKPSMGGGGSVKFPAECGRSVKLTTCLRIVGLSGRCVRISFRQLQFYHMYVWSSVVCLGCSYCSVARAKLFKVTSYFTALGTVIWMCGLCSWCHGTLYCVPRCFVVVLRNYGCWFSLIRRIFLGDLNLISFTGVWIQLFIHPLLENKLDRPAACNSIKCIFCIICVFVPF